MAASATRQADRGQRLAHGRTATSLRDNQRRDLDTAVRRILQAMRSHIDQGQLRAVGRSDSLTERVFVATRKVGREQQVHSVVNAAEADSGFVQPAIQFVRIGWLREIETCGADGDLERD
jgi:hypothetical protein